MVTQFAQNVRPLYRTVPFSAILSAPASLLYKPFFGTDEVRNFIKFGICRLTH